MLEETYDKFKLQFKNEKTSNDNLPETVYSSDEQVHHIYSYNNYGVKDNDVKMGLINTSIIQMSLPMNLNMAYLKI